MEKENKLVKTEKKIYFLENEEKSTEKPRFHRFYVGIDIGYKFHVASCIPIENFIDPKEKWKRAKTFKFNSDTEGLRQVFSVLEEVSKNPKDFFVLMEPTGGHYGYTLMRLLIDYGYDIFQVENKAVKDFRERNLGIKEKSDQIDARVMAYMGYHKAMHPSMAAVRIVSTATPTQMVFKTLTRDRWLLSSELTRRKNQVQQIFSVTNPDLKAIFSQPGRQAVLKLALEYPTALEMAKAKEEDIKNVLLKAGANRIANKAAEQIKKTIINPLVVDSQHLVDRQTWLIKEALRLQEGLDQIDDQIELLLFGSDEKGIEQHPYTQILFSFPTMSNNWASTLIGVIGDINRFQTYKQFKKYLGFIAQSSQSGTSVNKTRLSFDGVRDTRRILFQMALVLISPNMRNNVFKEYYKRLIEGRPNKSLPPMKKMTAIGHLCGKLAQVIYACLKNDVLYDAELHAKACGIDWSGNLDGKQEDIDINIYEEEANDLAERANILD